MFAPLQVNFGQVVVLSVCVSDQGWSVIGATSHDDSRQRDVDARIVATRLRRCAPVSAAGERRRRGAAWLCRHQGADVVGPPHHPARDRPAELLSEAPAHGAVDEEVERVAEQDDEVEKEIGKVAGVLGDERFTGSVLDDHDAHADSHWKLDEQEERDDYNQHQCGRVAFLLHARQTHNKTATRTTHRVSEKQDRRIMCVITLTIIELNYE